MVVSPSTDIVSAQIITISHAENKLSHQMQSVHVFRQLYSVN